MLKCTAFRFFIADFAMRMLFEWAASQHHNEPEQDTTKRYEVNSIYSSHCAIYSIKYHLHTVGVRSGAHNNSHHTFAVMRTK